MSKKLNGYWGGFGQLSKADYVSGHMGLRTEPTQGNNDQNSCHFVRECFLHCHFVSYDVQYIL